tara:strand:+ start:9735 stop:9929 length:195 start_codon:yes stop_codon:yes gene_type:complete
MYLVGYHVHSQSGKGLRKVRHILHKGAFARFGGADQGYFEFVGLHIFFNHAYLFFDDSYRGVGV